MSSPAIGKKIIVTVPSTTANLGPGFDCLGAALDLYNEFIFTRIEGGGVESLSIQALGPPRRSTR